MAETEQSDLKIYGYRWVVLLAFMFVAACNQLLWITFAPITGAAAEFYEVSDLSIGMLSMVFMVVFIVASLPASWAIDRFGIRASVGLGALLTGVFGLVRGVFADSYPLVLASHVGIALGQPLILNAITTVVARWFPVRERVTATGLGSLATYVGIVVGLVLTPYLMLRVEIAGVLMAYGVVSLASAVLFFLLFKESPPTPVCRPEEEERSLVLDGLKDSFKSRNFQLLLAVFFVGLGVFNAVTTWIEEILEPRGFSLVQSGNTGGLMIFGGVVGAIVMPLLSDYTRKRAPFVQAAILGATLGLVGLTFAQSYAMVLVSAFVFGFFLLSAGPVGFQYGAEVTRPAPEGTSNGMLLLMGQISGSVFIVVMDAMKSPDTGSMTVPLVVLVVLLVGCLLLGTRLTEPAELST